MRRARLRAALMQRLCGVCRCAWFIPNVHNVQKFYSQHRAVLARTWPIMTVVYTGYNTPSVFFLARMPRKDKKQELCSWIQEEIDDYYHWESAARDSDDDAEHGVGRALHPRHKILYFLF